MVGEWSAASGKCATHLMIGSVFLCQSLIHELQGLLKVLCLDCIPYLGICSILKLVHVEHRDMRAVTSDRYSCSFDALTPVRPLAARSGNWKWKWLRLCQKERGQYAAEFSGCVESLLAEARGI